MNRIPLRVLLADLLGTVLLGPGLYDLISAGDGLVPVVLRFSNYPWYMVGAGLILISVLVVHLVRSPVSRRTEG